MPPEEQQLTTVWRENRDRARLTVLLSGGFGALQCIGGTIMGALIAWWVAEARWVGGIVWAIAMLSGARELWRAYTAATRDPIVFEGSLVSKTRHSRISSRGSGVSGTWWTIQLEVENAYAFDVNGRTRARPVRGRRTLKCAPALWHELVEGEIARVVCTGAGDAWRKLSESPVTVRAK